MTEYKWGEWKKVDLIQYPFHFTEEHPEIDVYNKAVQKELGGKNLEYFWGEEGGNEPEYLDDNDWDLFVHKNWGIVFCCDGYGDDPTEDCNMFGLVSMIKGPPLKGVEWAINFEMNCSIWIREV